MVHRNLCARRMSSVDFNLLTAYFSFPQKFFKMNVVNLVVQFFSRACKIHTSCNLKIQKPRVKYTYAVSPPIDGFNLERTKTLQAGFMFSGIVIHLLILFVPQNGVLVDIIQSFFGFQRNFFFYLYQTTQSVPKLWKTCKNIRTFDVLQLSENYILIL